MIQSKAMAEEDHHQVMEDSHSNKDREDLAFKMGFHLAAEASLVEANSKCISTRLYIFISLLYHTHISFYISSSSINKYMFFKCRKAFTYKMFVLMCRWKMYITVFMFLNTTAFMIS